MLRAKLVGVVILVIVCLAVGANAGKQNSKQESRSGPNSSGPRGTKPPDYPPNALPGMTPAQVQQFLDAQDDFNEVEEATDGLGPIFNDTSCGVCHPNGGGSTRISNIIGLAGAAQFAAGGPVIQLKALPGFTPEVVPANVPVGQRRAMRTMGLGLIGAIADQAILDLQTLQANQTPLLAGKANIVTDAVVGNQRVGRIGQKSQHPNATSFAAEAYLREMGVTSPFFPNEEAPFNNQALLAGNPFPGINNDGSDVLAFGFFMDHLKPPTGGGGGGGGSRKSQSSDIQAGQAIFASIGCAVCHQPTWVTATNADQSLSQITFHPFSDFLLHDMGASGDQIPQGTDSNGQPIPGSWMRTTPLWGSQLNPALWHDGSIKQGDYTGAINKHDGQGLGTKVQYNNLSPTQQKQLLKFLQSL